MKSTFTAHQLKNFEDRGREIMAANSGGNFGHQGIPGHRGGSAPKGTSPIVRDEKTKTWKTPDGKEVPEHVNKLGIPPAWHSVHANMDPEGKVQAHGVDAKGRNQTIYHEKFVQQMAAEKFSRNKELIGKQEKVFKQNETNLSHEDPKVRENAAAMQLIQRTGIRPGSSADTGAEKQAYGATTLEGRHVVKDKDGNVSLQFVGKKGVNLNIPVEHEATAKMLLERKEASGENGKLFKTDDGSLREYSHTLDGGSFKPKDFRTLKGTQTAIEEIEKNPVKASSMTEFKKRVKDIATRVSQRLGNTPTIALQSYINPFVFDKIRPA